MDRIAWGTLNCINRVKVYNISEDLYYWRSCAKALFKEEQYREIGSAEPIWHILNICKKILEEIQEYSDRNHLDLKWREVLEEHKSFVRTMNNI